MSGIVALFERGGASPLPSTIDAMLGTMAHRGPDYCSTTIDGPVGLGQCMLETTEEDGLDRLPLKHRARKVWIAADVRLDNRAELGDRLGGEEPCRRVAEPRAEAPRAGLSDAALILAAYERWGTECPCRLLGDFAFVIWDGEQQRLFCARDQLGIRQLFYRADDHAFRCATEMKALFAEPGVARRPHWLSVASFVCETYTENEQTLYEGVSALPGAHALTVQARVLRLERYWSPDPWRRWAGASDSDYAERFAAVFGEAVRCRLRSSQPVAVHVSGGIDSSSVAVEIAGQRHEGQLAAQAPTLARLVFPGLECDEAAYSQAVADACGRPTLTLSALDDDQALDPHVDPAHPDLYYWPALHCLLPLLRQTLARGMRTTLTGLDADLLFVETNAEAAADLRAGHVRRAITSMGLGERPFALDSWKALYRAVRALGPRRMRGDLGFGAPRRSPPVPWLSQRAWRALRAEHHAALRRTAHVEHPDPATRAVWENLEGPPLKYGAARWDRVAASVGAELRHPFLDLRLVELVLSMPREQRTAPGLDKPKPVLRRAMKGKLPEIVRGRLQLADFTDYIGLPLDRHRDRIVRLFEDSRLAAAGILDPGPVQRMLASSGRSDSLRLSLVGLIALELWLRHLLS
jgi:asparagine synthase (glutamine-hydrolysing)